MNVCLISDRFFPEHGGGGTTYANALAGLLSKKHNVSVLTIDFNSLGNEKKNNLEVFRISLENSAWSSKGFIEFCKKAKSFVDSNSFDLVHAMNPSVGLFLKKNSFITTAHGSSLSELFSLLSEGSINFGSFKRAINAYFAELLCIQKSLKTITTSIAAKNEIKSHYFYSNPEMIYYCVDSVFTPSNVSRDYVLFAGRLSERKGIITLLKAIKDSEISLHIVGDGVLKEKLQQYINDNKMQSRVKFFGWLNGKELLQQFQECKFLVTPSNYEIFGIVNIEAMACGKAVIASNVCGIPEIVKHEENGLLCSPGNVKEFSNAINLLYKNVAFRQSLEKNALKTAEMFNENIFLQKHLALYEKFEKFGEIK